MKKLLMNIAIFGVKTLIKHLLKRYHFKNVAEIVEMFKGEFDEK